MPTDESFLKTQVHVLESDNLAWQTIQQLGLTENPKFVSHLGIAAGEASDPQMGHDLLIREFRQHLNVGLAPNSRIIEVSFENTDPEMAAKVVNALVAGYLNYNFHT